MRTVQEQRDDLAEQHLRLEGSLSSPYMSSMERYYLSNPAGFRGKIMTATWIHREVRVHMVDHVALALGRGRRRPSVRRVAFRQFLRDPAMKRVESKRHVYTRDKRGRVQKRDRRGRFVAFSQKERREVSKSHGR